MMHFPLLYFLFLLEIFFGFLLSLDYLPLKGVILPFTDLLTPINLPRLPVCLLNFVFVIIFYYITLIY